ncbi:lipopolysaccharide biosynthesis protein [Bacteroides sp. 519]|uniref:lipopolysaccharide biosynthesis protein n=1 Tax=Bacteroides sp. 519 TaxID=2302937 RepID=UPI0013D7BF95|nr:oligosaccharide flippase family protein [Bacteroides sp. 519]NDV58981.1 hypothetical protein [Bacteroides sp. 519]
MASRSSKVISLSLAQGIVTLITVVSAMVFARYLSVADYATYLQTFLAYDFLVPVLTLGLPSALYYFLPSAGNDSKGIVIDNMALLFFSSLIFSSFLILGGTELLAKRFDNPNLLHTLKWLSFYPLYTFPVLILSPILVIKDKVQLNAKYNVFTGIALMCSVIFATIYAKDYQAPILTRIIVPILFFPIALYFSFRYVLGNWRLPNSSSMWRILKFSIPLGLASILGTLTLQLSNLIVSILCTPEEYAIYANGAREIPMIGIITGSISVVIMADMSKQCKENKKEDALVLFKKSISIGASFLIPLMVYLFVFGKSFIKVLYTDKYIDSLIPFTILLLLLPIRSINFGSIFIAIGKSKLVLYRSVIELFLTMFFVFFYVKHWGYSGAAFALVFTIYLWTIPYNLFTLGKEFSVSPFLVIPFKNFFRIFAISLLSIVFPSITLFFEISPLLELIFTFFCFILIYLFLAYKYIPDLTFFKHAKR